jgi:hypothetical protein
MTKIVLFLLPLFLVSKSVQSQTSIDSVKTTINQFFKAMRSADTKAMLSCFTDSAILQTIVSNVSGEPEVKTEKLSEFAAVVTSLPKDAADERIVFDMVKTDGPLAIAWTPYRFYFNGKFSHCGVNSFQLVRQNVSWKIQYIIDTRRKQACE